MKKYRVLLINPTNSVSVKNKLSINVYQPIGLAYIASSLINNGHFVNLLDCLAMDFSKKKKIRNRWVYGLEDEPIKKYLKEFQPDIVGISIPFSSQSFDGHRMAKLVKKVNPKIVIVGGGVHATIQPEELLYDHNFDYIIRGEGEISFPLLLKLIHNKNLLKKIPGLSYVNQDGTIHHSQPSLPIINLDRLSYPARDLLPMDKYHEAAKQGKVNESLLSFGKNRTSIITSRGCPFLCSFCSVHLTMTRTWRGRTPKNVVSEIQECVHKFKIKYFDILDDNFTLDPDRAKEICRLIIKNNLNITWSTPNGIRADRVDEELIRLMKKSGCIQIKVAPESGSPNVLKNIIKKNLDLNTVEKVVMLCRQHRLSVEAFFVIGFPEETVHEIKQTIMFAQKLRRLGCDYCYFFIATPYYGTEFYKDSVAKGYLNESKYDPITVSTTGHSPIFKSPNYSRKDLTNLQKIASQINPPVTKIRLISGLKMLLIDPKRVIGHAFNYLASFRP